MSGRRRLRSVLPLLLLGCCAVAPARGQTIIANQMYKSLMFELRSVRDDVLLYVGDPQYVFQIEMRPHGSMAPKIDFQNAAQVATLRVRDLTLFETHEPPPPEDEEDPDAMPEEEKGKRPPDSQGWDVQLMPSAATDFVLQCDGGKGVFDFTDIPAQEVYLQTDTTDVRIEFKRPNPVELRRFKLTAVAGRVELHHFLNARARSATVAVADASCDIDLTGKPWPGEGEIFFEGTPRSMRITVPAGIGLQLDGPAATVSRFDRQNMQRVESSLVSAGYDGQACRLHLYFAQPVPKLEVRWQE